MSGDGLERASRRGKGAGRERVWTVPARWAVAPTDASRTSAMVRSSICGTERVLVVEDDDAVREFAAEALTELGYRVVAATTGDDALGILAHERNGIDVVFSDIVMPGHATGMKLAHALMAIRPALPIVLTSGYADGASNLVGLPRSVRLLRKPYHVTELALAIRAALGEAAGQA